MKLDLDRIAAALPSASRAEVEQLAVEWSRRPAGDPSDFISWVHHNERLPAESVRHLARSTRTPVMVGPPDLRVREIGAIGRGAMGEIVLARDEALHRTIAIKRLHPHAAANPDLVRRFVTEAQLTAQLDHPGIVPVYAFVPEEGQAAPAYSMKLLRGRTLSSWLEDARQATKVGPLPTRQALAARLELFLSICEPIAYAHARGVIHRDLKPDNIMVGRFGEVVVMDWGMARLIGRAEEVGLELGMPSPEVTSIGTVIGTPAYMPPEQANGETEGLDGRADQFALGLLLYELCALRRARGSVKNGIPMLLAAIKGHLDPIMPKAEPLAPELVKVIHKATALRPEDRYPDVSALADDIRHVLRGEPVVAAPDTALQRLGRALARQRERLAAGLLMVSTAFVFVLLSSIILIFVVREWDRRVADEKTTRLVTITAAAADHARKLDGALTRFEGLLRSLAAVGQRTLAGCDAGLRCAAPPGPTPRVFMASDFQNPRSAPPDLFQSPIYAGMASFDHPDLIAAPGIATDGMRSYLENLASMLPFLRQSLLDSAGGTTNPRQKVLTDGTPLVWSYVGTAAGVLVGYPGVGRYPEAYDPREQPWYQRGMGESTPIWEEPYEDESGMGQLVSCVMPVSDGNGNKIGVAGLDLTITYLGRTFLAPSTPGSEGFLLDGEGKVVVRARAGGTQVESGGAPPWPVKKMLASPAGNTEESGTLLAWSRLGHGWTYVMSEPAL